MIVYSSSKYEVHVEEKDDGLHVYSYRRVDGKTYKPLGFILGSNALHHEAKKEKA